MSTAIYAGFRLTEGDEPLIAKMPPAMQDAVRHAGTMQEYADAKKVQLGTAKSRIHRARARLSRMRAGAPAPRYQMHTRLRRLTADEIRGDVRTAWADVPPHMWPGIRRYVEAGIEPGDFLTAVLQGKKREAYARADPVNKAAWQHWLRFLEILPPKLHGSPVKFEAWKAMKGLQGYPVAP